MIPLFVSAVFVGAWLLFAVQPMAGKMLLPQLGGTPAVWNTCMVGFQGLLLAGYLYAHGLTRWLGSRAQVAVHGGLLAVGLAFLPLALADGADAVAAVESPVAWILARLVAGLGLPFVAVAATGPLLQRWLSLSDHPDARDPYYLYAASNLGSLAALLAYPFLLEPSLALASQSGLWSAGYLACAAGCVASGAWMLRRPAAETARPTAATRAPRNGDSRGAWSERAIWLGLAFVPSSAMLGTTLELTTDIAAVPLLWVLPLAAYLVTFVVAFAPRVPVPRRATGVALAVLCLAVAVSRWVFVRPPPEWGIPLHLATLVAVGLVCHGRLADRRPEPERLTGYYLWIALGGALGGVFNALVAPLVFDAVVELPLVLVGACALIPARAGAAGFRWSDLALPAALGAFVVAAHSLLAGAVPDRASRMVVEAALAALLCAALVGRPLRFAAGLAVVLVAASAYDFPTGETLHAERTFFGVVRVTRNTARVSISDRPGGPGEIREIVSHDLLHGTTRHGRQVQEAGGGGRPASYYHATGPLGQVFRALGPRLRDAGFVGLGAGAVAAYGRPGQRFVFFELDPAVARIAANPAFFSHLASGRAEQHVRTGDGRVLLGREPDAGLDLIVVDAFTSDAVPVHLLTREAFALYFRKLRPEGLLALHLTNGFFDLRPVAAAAARDRGLEGLWWDDAEVTPEQKLDGKARSLWVVVGRDAAALAAFRARHDWQPLADVPRADEPRMLWTDGFSSPLATRRP